MYRISSIIILALLSAAIHTAAAEYDMVRHSSGETQVIQDSTINNTPQPSGSIQTDLLEEKLTEYLSALDREPADVKCREADFIIGVCTDSSVRQSVAMKAYRHFFNSKIMGDEAVAIHIYDRWFSTGTVRMDSEADLWAAGLFAESNRNSLVGCKAPELSLKDREGRQTDIFGPDDPQKGYRILYFYDTDCAKCRIESILLRNILENSGYSAALYAVYTGQSREKWEDYIKEQLDISSPEITVLHLWDPDRTSDFTMKYGVLQTPRLFLVSPDGTISGRGLDVYALEQLLSLSDPHPSLEYGSDEAMEMFGKAFAPIEKDMGCDGISGIAGHISEQTLQARDTTLYRQLVGDLLYYVSSRREEQFKCGLTQFIDKYILGRSDIWNTADDSLKVTGLAFMLKNLDALTPAGSRLPELDVYGTLKSYRSNRPPKLQTGIFRTDRLHSRGRLIMIFHTEGCPVCETELAAAEELLRTEKKLKVLEVNMDELFISYPSEAETVMAGFDLSSLPLIIELDSKGRVSRKYISLLR